MKVHYRIKTVSPFKPHKELIQNKGTYITYGCHNANPVNSSTSPLKVTCVVCRRHSAWTEVMKRPAGRVEHTRRRPLADRDRLDAANLYARLRVERDKAQKTLSDVLDQFADVDWCYENNMGVAHVNLSKSQLKEWCKAAKMSVPEQGSDFYR